MFCMARKGCPLKVEMALRDQLDVTARAAADSVLLELGNAGRTVDIRGYAPDTPLSDQEALMDSKSSSTGIAC